MFGNIKGIILNESHNFRFWNKVNCTRNKEDCWYWGDYALDIFEYGRIHINGKNLRASQVALALSGVNIKKGDLVLHSQKCVTNAIMNFGDGTISRKCCNPNHLRIGTYKENSQDTQELGRAKGLFDGTKYSYGEKHYHAKLSKKEIEKIRKDNRPQKEIAEEYKVNQATISRIKNNKRRRLG